MADNKVVNTTQLEADLVSIADAIRAKAESSDSLVFPSGFVDAIANIVTGGGLPDGVSALATGTYTPTSKTQGKITITHNLGVEPSFYIFAKQNWATRSDTSGTQPIFLDFYIGKNSWLSTKSKRNHAIKCIVAATGSASIIESPSIESRVDATTFWVEGNSAYDRNYEAGETFIWICGVINNF